MTWHKVELNIRTRSFGAGREHMIKARKWCEESLSSNGVLWKHDSIIDWTEFYFAQPQDVIVFKLMFA